MPFQRHLAITPVRPPMMTPPILPTESEMSDVTTLPAPSSPNQSKGTSLNLPHQNGVDVIPKTSESRVSRRPTDALTHLAQFGSGALAGLVNTLVLSPLDVVKTRLQAQGAGVLQTTNYRGPIDALRAMLRQEGFQSYYRGLSASLWAFVPNWAIYWYSYESFKRFYTRSGQPPSPFVHIISAISAGGVTAVTTAPFWTLKSRLQVDMAVSTANRRYRSVPHGFRTIIKEEGISGLYKGLTPTLLGLGHVAIQFPLYEHLKATFAKQPQKNDKSGLKATHILAASSLSKVVASAMFYPHEVIRTRIQVDTSTAVKSFEIVKVWDLIRRIVRTDGVSGLYRGFGANLVRTVPACMLTFTSYELAKRFAESHASLPRRIAESSASTDGASESDQRQAASKSQSSKVLR